MTHREVGKSAEQSYESKIRKEVGAVYIFYYLGTYALSCCASLFTCLRVCSAAMLKKQRIATQASEM
ncbi:hypothetical protein ACN4Z1_00505 [Legionella sp. ST3F1]